MCLSFSPYFYSELSFFYFIKTSEICLENVYKLLDLSLTTENLLQLIAVHLDLLSLAGLINIYNDSIVKAPSDNASKCAV